MRFVIPVETGANPVINIGYNESCSAWFKGDQVAIQADSAKVKGRALENLDGRANSFL